MSETEEERDEAEVFTAEGELAWPPAEYDMPLRKPVEHGGILYERLQLREPTEDEFDKILALPERRRRRLSVSMIAIIPEGAVAKMGIGDVVRAEAYLTSFFDIGQVIGVSPQRVSPTSTDGLPTSSDASPGAN